MSFESFFELSVKLIICDIFNSVESITLSVTLHFTKFTSFVELYENTFMKQCERYLPVQN